MNRHRPLFITSDKRDEKAPDGSDTTNEDFWITDMRDTFRKTPKFAKLVEAQIPYTWYNIITDLNDQIYLKVFYDNATEFDAVITLPANNYTGESLATALQDLINAEAGHAGWVVTFDTSTFKYTIKNENIAPVPTQIIVSFEVANGVDYPANDIMGFDVTTISTIDPGTGITSTKVAEFTKDKVIWICSNWVPGTDSGVIPWRPGKAPNPADSSLSEAEFQIFHVVPICTCFGGIICHKAHTCLPFLNIEHSDFAKRTTDATRKVRFFLRFPSGFPLNLNGHCWSMQVVLDFDSDPGSSVAGVPY